MASGSEKKMRTKAKGAPHGLHYEILDDPNIKAESGWEEEEGEYWTFKTCKKYVKMYHIDKLWPRDCHVVHTHGFCCKPRNCNNKHFVHRAEEVWRALFGDKPRSKGCINYSVASMVYAELILNRKVDWSTYPSKVDSPLLLQPNQKDIPDLYHSQAEAAEPSEPRKTPKVLKNTTTRTTKVSEVLGDAVQLRPAEVAQPCTEVTNVSSGGVDGEVFVTPPTCFTFTPNVITLGAQSTAPSKETTTNETTLGGVDMAANKETLLEERGSPFSPDGEVNEEQLARTNATIQGYIDSKALESLVEYATPISQLPTTPRRSQALSPIRMPSPHQRASPSRRLSPRQILSPRIGRHPHLASLSSAQLEILSSIPSANQLEKLLECCSHWRVLAEQHLHSNPENEAGSSSQPARESGWGTISQTAYRLRTSAQMVAEITPYVRDMADEFSRMAPELLTGALAFCNFIEKLGPILEGGVMNLKNLMALDEDIHQLKMKCEELEKKLQLSQKNMQHERCNNIVQRKRIEELELEVQELKRGRPTTESVNIPSVQESQESDQLSLPLEKAKAVETSIILNVDEVGNDKKCEDVVRTIIPNVSPTLHDASTQMKGGEVEELQLKLDEAIQEKILVQLELSRFQKIMGMEECLPKSGFESGWLAWVQKLQDKPSVVSRAMKALMKFAMKSDEECNAVENSLDRFKKVHYEHLRGSTEITRWGDMDDMFERLNHAKKDDVAHIDWALEVEEGWVPYNTLSAHIKVKEKTVVHACDPAPGILKSHCSLCQGPFGPEGALTMGQCRHTFHVTCIVKASLIRSVCAECRAPLSPRFYEMLGILEDMPPGHEYNRWTLPLDQGPYHFQNFLHWGRPLTWDSIACRHGLYEESGEPVDPFMWMTVNREVELRARNIEDGEARELFCRNMGGHWSVQHNKFFRFPEKEVKKGPNNTWVEVEHAQEFNEQYGAYNHTLIGRALFLSKLEEAAKVRALVEIDGETTTGHSFVEVAGAFDKRIGDIIVEWRGFLLGDSRPIRFAIEAADEQVNVFVDRVDAALRALKVEEVDLSPKRTSKRKREDDDDDDHSPETKRQFSAVDMEVRSGGGVVYNPGPNTRRMSARLLAKEGPSHDLGESSGS